MVVLIIIIILIISSFFVVFADFRKTGGGENAWMKYRPSRYSFINFNTFLSDCSFVLGINDNRFKAHGNEWKPKVLHWRTDSEKGEMLHCLEVLQPRTGKPIPTDILMYNNKDVRSLEIRDRLNILDELCKKIDLPKPSYILFSNQDNISEQMRDACITKNTKIIISKKLNQSYYNSTKIWVSSELLSLYGRVINHKLVFPMGNSWAEIRSKEFPVKTPKITGQVEIYKDKNNEIHFKPTDISPDNIFMAEKVWREINKGPRIESLLDKDLMFMKSLHRNAESPLIFNKIKDNSTILDIGAGRGANIRHWKTKKLKVFAVEPNKENYKILENKNSIYKINTLNARGQDSAKILKFVSGKKINYIVMIYSLTFFFENDKTLQSLVDMIDKILEPDGYFMGTVMDGGKLLQHMKKNRFECPPIYIQAESDDYKIGNKIVINIDDKTTLVKNQTEYLVVFEELVNKLREKNIILDSTGFLGGGEILSDCPKKFTDMMRWFIFKKQ